MTRTAIFVGRAVVASRREVQMGAAERKGAERRPESLEREHRRLFGEYSGGRAVTSSDKRGFEIFSLYKPSRMTYSSVTGGR
uniref:hypothetical protein n=1 Tax=Olsenella uli TaxID=133926 RepID=UPI0028E8F5FC|nr:hypothetical protein [Olsenella uli]